MCQLCALDRASPRQSLHKLREIIRCKMRVATPHIHRMPTSGLLKRIQRCALVYVPRNPRTAQPEPASGKDTKMRAIRTAHENGRLLCTSPQPVCPHPAGTPFERCARSAARRARSAGEVTSRSVPELRGYDGHAAVQAGSWQQQDEIERIKRLAPGDRARDVKQILPLASSVIERFTEETIIAGLAAGAAREQSLLSRHDG